MARKIDSVPARGFWQGLLLTGAGAVVAIQAAWSGAAARDPREKIEPAVLEIAAAGEARFWVLLRDRADLAPAHRLSGDDARGDN